MKNTLVLDLASQLTKIKDLDLLLDKLLYNARLITSADAGSVYLIKDTTNLKIHSSQNDTLQSRLGEGARLPYKNIVFPITDQTISGYVVKSSSMLNIPNMYEIPEDCPYSFKADFDIQNNYKTISSLTYPLKTETGEVLGVLQLLNSKDDDGNVVIFDSELERCIQLFADIASNALERAHFTRSLIDRMITMAAMRDPKETATHATRIGAFSSEVYEAWARRRNFEEEKIEKEKDILRVSAMLHDVGKVGISDLVLKKPGRFSEEDRAVMEDHSYLGAKIFEQSFNEYDEVAQEIALRHHENWDGSGYPGHIDFETGLPASGTRVGLQGDEISLYARIVSLCDVYDALIHRRCYKDPWEEDEVLAELKKLSGTKFDPEIVEIFFECYPFIKDINNRYPE